MSAATAAARARPRARNPEEEDAYLHGMANLCLERGFLNLARSYQLAAGLTLPDDIRAAELARSWVLHEDRLEALALEREAA